ncbi:MAG: 6-carboxyhexanoate--CoA ligase [Aquificaceae bacterium]
MYSVRMRAELKDEHVSGAERLVQKEYLEKVLQELLRRPKKYDKMVITVEEIKKVKTIEKALPIYSYDFESVGKAHEFAAEKLKSIGIEHHVVSKALELLRFGPNPKGGNMRGAVLIDLESGERLEPDQERGIRTVGFDWKDRAFVKKILKERGIKRFYLERLIDALALATKNIYCGVIAEICWSDDPDYTTGYVAGKGLGYIRIKPMKEEGSALGGRVYFVKRKNLQTIIECLEEKMVLIENV